MIPRLRARFVTTSAVAVLLLATAPLFGFELPTLDPIPPIPAQQPLGSVIETGTGNQRTVTVTDTTTLSANPRRFSACALLTNVGPSVPHAAPCTTEIPLP